MTTAKWYTPSGRSIQKERKMIDGAYVEVHPDSLESDSARRARPAYKSDAGRVVYGGGAITPDIMVRPDTLTTAEQNLQKALAPKFGQFFTALRDIAVEQRGKVTTDFSVQPQWREELYSRLAKDSVKIDRAQWTAGQSYIDRQLELQVAHVAFGDSTQARHALKDDPQLQRAIDLLKKGGTQKDLFAVAQAAARSVPQR
jgi:carboxyl-terminal processing protease